MIIYLLIVLALKYITKYFLIKYDYHNIFRSIFCLVISLSSLSISLLNWNNLINNPLDSMIFSSIINKLMFCYMIYDLFYFFIKQKIRYELCFHHIICALLFYNYNYNILTFCSTCEILSGFNWISLIYPKYEWMSKYIRLITILFVRFWVWMTTLIIFMNYKKVNIIFHITTRLIINIQIFNFVLLLIIIFISLDIYWLSVIYKNFNKNYKFIKNKLLKNRRKK
jgi:hypothetical protein